MDQGRIIVVLEAAVTANSPTRWTASPSSTACSRRPSSSSTANPKEIPHEPARHAEGACRRRRRARRRHRSARRGAAGAGGIEALKIKWSKAPCRFCGTGCGVMVGVKEGRVVATHGDMLAEVNRGLNCVKGYFLSKIMYGADRLTQPLLRKRNGVYAKDGEFTPVTWDEAFDVMAAQAKRVLKAKGPTARRHVRVGPVDDLGGLRRHQADARRLPLQQPRSQCAPLHGLGGVRVHAHLRHGRADGLLRRFRAGRRVRAVGLEHGGDASDPVDAADRSPAVSAPHVQGRGAVHVHQPQFRSRRYADRVQARHRSGDPQLHRQPHHHDRPGEPGFRPRAYDVHARRRPTSATGCGRTHPLEKKATGAADPGATHADGFRRLRGVREGLHAGEGRRS